MKYAGYVKSCVWEFILCVTMFSSLSYMIASGFHVPAGVQHDLLVLLCGTGLATAALFLASYDKKTIGISLIAFFAAMVLLLIVIQSNASMRQVFSDQETNPYLYFIILCLVSITGYLLSRTKLGNGIFFVAGMFIAALIQFLYESGHIWATLLFIISCGAMQIFKTYKNNALTTQTVKVDFARTFVISLILMALIVCISAGMFYGIVKPLDPPARELKLITKYMSLEVLEKIGIASEVILTDPNRLTQDTDDTTQTSRKEGDEQKDAPNESQDGKQEDQEKQQQQDNQANQLDPDQNSKVFYAIKYAAKNVSPLWWMLLPLLLLLAAVLLKLWMRKHWLKKIKDRPPKEQINAFYHFYLKKFRQMGIKKLGEETPLEFAQRAKANLKKFVVGSTEFQDLTAVFLKCGYGNMEPTKTEYQRYLTFYQGFYPCCRRHLGKFKYILNFFRL